MSLVKWLSKPKAPTTFISITGTNDTMDGEPIKVTEVDLSTHNIYERLGTEKPSNHEVHVRSNVPELRSGVNFGIHSGMCSSEKDPMYRHKNLYYDAYMLDTSYNNFFLRSRSDQEIPTYQDLMIKRSLFRGRSKYRHIGTQLLKSKIGTLTSTAVMHSDQAASRCILSCKRTKDILSGYVVETSPNDDVAPLRMVPAVFAIHGEHIEVLFNRPLTHYQVILIRGKTDRNYLEFVRDAHDRQVIPVEAEKLPDV